MAGPSAGGKPPQPRLRRRPSTLAQRRSRHDLATRHLAGGHEGAETFVGRSHGGETSIAHLGQSEDAVPVRKTAMPGGYGCEERVLGGLQGDSHRLHHGLLGLAPQLDDVRNRTRPDTSRASRTGIGFDNVRLPVAVDPCPESVSKRQEPLVCSSQRADLKDGVRASRDTGALGVGAGVMVPTLALGAVDYRNEEPRLLLFPALAHVVSPRRPTATECILDRHRGAESRTCPLVLTARRGLAAIAA